MEGIKQPKIPKNEVKRMQKGPTDQLFGLYFLITYGCSQPETSQLTAATLAVLQGTKETSGWRPFPLHRHTSPKIQ
jgi:hypothetical protein